MASKQSEFQKIVWDYFQAHRRDLPWRVPEPGGLFDPYKIMVSEVMLQQTQVSRVIPKYQEFLAVFPNLEVLSKASLASVIKTWSGLGYNRRAKYLHDTAKAIQQENEGKFPKTLNMLTKLPGIGPNTAAAILVYSFNQPLNFIETNIRTAYIHHFFSDESGVTDGQLMPLITATIDRDNPREWYWALMDYGSYLKTSSGNAARRSHHYKKQTAFKGSLRQLRGAIMRELAARPLGEAELLLRLDDERSILAIEGLKKDGLIQQTVKGYKLAQ